MSKTLRLQGALVMGVSTIALTVAGQAYAAGASASDSSGGGTTVGELVVTAEKREQSLQDVPVAISAFTSQKRDLIGVQTIQDMTNFTPGLQYSTSTDRISLRGVGRLTNVLSADASVANYNDGVYETFAVAAGRSSLFLDRVEVLRGPQGTLYGRNAIGGALNEISRRPTMTPYAEARIRYENYNHINLEAAVSGPLSDNVQVRVAGEWEKQSQGWIKVVTPGLRDEGNVIDQWFAEGQIQVKFSDRLEMWTKVAGAQWHNGAGGPGANSAAWTPMGSWPTYLYGVAATSLNVGYGCGPQALNVTTTGNTSVAAACTNPDLNTPWRKAAGSGYKVYLPAYIGVSSQWTWHNDAFDIKYVTGGVYYHYVLTGSVPNGYNDAPITGYTIPCATGAEGGTCRFGGALRINPQETFNYQELNGFWSHEINFISTGDGPLQWVFGAYLFNQHYHQPVYTTAPDDSHWNGPFGAPGALCAGTGGVCAQETGFRRFDNRPDVHARSEAIFGQFDWKVSETIKLTGGLRYSWDRKWGTESVRLLCWGVPACFTNPATFGAFTQPVDLTQLPSVVSAPAGTPSDPFPTAVTSKTTYDPVTGLATRHYDATWSAITGTAGVEWSPDSDTMFYGKYSRGYKSGGFNIGIFTVLSFFPWTDKETVDSFEIGLKKDFGHTLQLNMAAFHYGYKNLQVPIAVVATSGGLAQATTAFYNVPRAVSQGFELEGIWSPIENLNFIISYGYLDAKSTAGVVVDSSDPAGLQPNAQLAGPRCVAVSPVCATDIYTVGLPGGGFQNPQLLKGNRLPNAPKNKIALNATYNFRFDAGTLTPSVSYIWRDVQYGSLFTRWYNRAPSWDQVDARVTWKAANGKYTIIAFVKNAFDQLGYDNGATSGRQAGTITDPTTGALVNFVQGVNNPVGYGAIAGVQQGIAKTYSVTPPRLYGIEFQYKFF